MAWKRRPSHLHLSPPSLTLYIYRSGGPSLDMGELFNRVTRECILVADFSAHHPFLCSTSESNEKGRHPHQVMLETDAISLS